MCVKAIILVLRPDGLGLVELGDREDPSMGRSIGAEVGAESGCLRFELRP